MWTEPAIGPESRSVRRWAKRILPGRIARALVALALAFIFILALGRLQNVDPTGCSLAFTDCWHFDNGPSDIWDAIF